MLNSFWRSTPGNFTLDEHEVHVWRAPLDWPLPRVQLLQQTLSEDEGQRADRFHFAHDRLHYIVARGLLRTLLGRYLQQPPGELRFTYNPYGKPTLASVPGQANVSFNLSHSGGLVLYAFARRRDLGIDVEKMRTNLVYEQIAEHVFSVGERDVLRALPADQKVDAFFNGWARKEAYIKARGRGLSLPLTEFDVTMRPAEPARLISTRGEPEAVHAWSLQELPIDPGYKAALVVEGHGWQLTGWQWNGDEA